MRAARCCCHGHHPSVPTKDHLTRALREFRQRAPHIPLIIDAGIRLPSHACKVMWWGFDGVLLNTAISRAIDPLLMARAFSASVQAGREAYLAGPMALTASGVNSTPELSRLSMADFCESTDIGSVPRAQSAADRLL